MSLLAISPIDGRYAHKVSGLVDFFSEKALFEYRVRIEIEYFIALCQLPLAPLQKIEKKHFEKIRKIYNNFTEENAQVIKEIEKITNHDIKAVEYFIKHIMERIELGDFKEFIHFGLTSQDINNTAIPLSIKEALEQVFIPLVEKLIQAIEHKATKWKDIALLAHTHGQPASPTRLGKEFRVFSTRLNAQLENLKNIPIAAKFGGATGNFNAHKVSYPAVDWKAFGKNFVENTLGLHYSFPTTQIEHYDYLAAIFDAMKRINTILIDFNRDIWTYISMGYFQQKVIAGEVGSSAMPHKINPIDFENSEGNLGVANAILQHMAAKLPVSRLQRDLTDSTVLRNVGVPFAHAIIAFTATLKGLDKLIVNQEAINNDLDNNWAVVAEAIQTVLRREQYPNPYEALKDLTRNNEKITKESIQHFIDTLAIPKTVKKELKAITPFNYTGINS